MRRHVGSRRAVVVTAIALSVAIVIFAVLERSQATPPARIAVIEATRDIQISEPITAAMLQVVQVPENAPVGPAPALAGDLGQIERSTARAPIFAGEIIQTLRLYGPGLALTSAPDAVFLKKGYALYTLPTGHLLMPLSGLAAGDYVEVLAALPAEPTVAAGATGSITTTVQPVDAHALVTYVPPDQAAITLAVPKVELPYLDWLMGHGAAFSFAQVRPDDAGGALAGVTLRQFRERYHVPHQ